MSPLAFMQRLAKRVPEPCLHLIGRRVVQTVRTRRLGCHGTCGTAA